MSVFAGAITDDFIGGVELAGLLAQNDVDVSLRVGQPLESLKEVSQFEVAALDLRDKPPAEAAAEADTALNWLQARKTSRFYWKYGSSFTSANIGAVADRLMLRLGVANTIYCPASPQKNRTVYKGMLYVGDDLLHESFLQAYFEPPPADSNLLRVLDDQAKGRIGLIPLEAITAGHDALRDRLHTVSAAGCRHMVIDAISAKDIETIAGTTWRMRLVTGSAALAAPLGAYYAAELGEQRSRLFQPGSIDGGEIVFAASRSRTNAAQVAHFARKNPSFQLGPLPLDKDNRLLDKARNWLASQPLDQRKIIFVERPRFARIKPGGQTLDQAFAVLARDAFNAGCHRFVVSGSGIARAVAEELAPLRLRIGHNIAPGIPWCFTNTNQGEIALTFKAGMAGSESFFETALDRLN